MSSRSRSERVRDRSIASREMERKRVEKQIRDLKAQIQTRLISLPRSWLQKYEEKLEANGINPDADINRIYNLDNLHKRKSLLPPGTTYRQHVNPRHPSRPEHRALACKLLEGHTRDYAAKVCSNDRIIRDALTRPEGTNVRRFKPENVAYLKLGPNQGVCVHPNNVKQMNRNGFQVAANYQRDSNAEEWPEVRMDVPFSINRSGTGWTPGETLQVRLPYHVAQECNIDLKPQKNRLSHPTHPEEA